MTSIAESTKRLADALERQRKIMPPEVQREWAEREKREAELAAMLRTNCIDAIELLAAAMRSPRSSMPDLESAIAMLTVARDCAKSLAE